MSSSLKLNMECPKTSVELESLETLLEETITSDALASVNSTSVKVVGTTVNALCINGTTRKLDTSRQLSTSVVDAQFTTTLELLCGSTCTEEDASHANSTSETFAAELSSSVNDGKRNFDACVFIPNQKYSLTLHDVPTNKGHFAGLLQSAAQNNSGLSFLSSVSIQPLDASSFIQTLQVTRVMVCNKRHTFSLRTVCSSLSLSLCQGLFDFKDRTIYQHCNVTAGNVTHLRCIATTDAPSSGELKTSLSVGGCDAGFSAATVGDSKAVELNVTQCSNLGTCTFRHCFRSDYFFQYTSILASMHEVTSTITFDKEGVWSADIQIAPFAASEVNEEVSRTVYVEVKVGSCTDQEPIDKFSIGETAALCIFTTDSDVSLSLKDVRAEPGNQVLVDSFGNPNWVSSVNNSASREVTLKTLMIPVYFDSQAGGGAVTIDGKAVITYTRRSLVVDEHMQKKSEDHSFSINLNLFSDDQMQKSSLKSSAMQKYRSVNSGLAKAVSILTTLIV